MKQLYFLDVGFADDRGLTDALFMSVSPAKRDTLRRCRNETDMIVGAYADVFMRCLLSRETGVGYGALAFGAGRAGKPFLEGAVCHFNLSHTRSAVAVALSDAPVGVDVERVRPVDLSIAGEIFAAGELKQLEREGVDACRCFFELWTKKEALLKYNGDGLTRSLKSFDVTDSSVPEKTATFLVDDYCISVCSKCAFVQSDLILVGGEEFSALWRDYACRI